MTEPVSRRIPPAEATEYPWWVIIDPARAMLPHPEDVGGFGPCDVSAEDLALVMTGPFFSRDAANAYLRKKKHRFSTRARVWCASGHESDDWREFCIGSRTPDHRVDLLQELLDGMAYAQAEDLPHIVAALREQVRDVMEE